MRELYKAHFQGLERDFALTEQSLHSQIKELTIERKRVDQILDYKKATSARLKTELAEARAGKTEAESRTSVANAERDTACNMQKLVELQMINQGKVIDRLLINGMSRSKPNQDDPLSGRFTSPFRFLTFINLYLFRMFANGCRLHI